MIGLFTSLALAGPSFSAGIEGVAAKRTSHAELGGGLRVGLHGERVTAELTGAWVTTTPGYVASQWNPHHRRQGELSTLVGGAFERDMGRVGRVRTKLALDALAGGGLRLERRCPGSFDGLWDGPGCASEYLGEVQPHVVVSFGPRLAVGRFALFSRLEPHLTFVRDRASFPTDPRFTFWTDFKLGLRATL